MRKRILLVDDEPFTMASMINHLADEGFEIESAADLSKAQDVLKNRKFDALK